MSSFVGYLNDVALRFAHTIESMEANVESCRGDLTAEELARMEAGIVRVRELRDRVRRVRTFFLPVAKAADALGIDAEVWGRLAEKLFAANDPEALRIAALVESVADGTLEGDSAGE